MYSLQKSVALIIPCFNEKQRLKLESFRSIPDFIDLYFVDDGSTDGTMEYLKSFDLDRSNFFKLDLNQGKSNAVYAGFNQVFNKGIEYDYIGFWDADLATPLNEVQNFIQYSSFFYPQADALYGSRVLRAGSEIKRSFQRHILGRGFATVVSLLFDIKIYDSQCGAKLFKYESAKKVFDRPFLSKWIFDVEITLRLLFLNKDIVEVPLQHWKDIEGSKIRIFRESYRVIYDLLNLWKIYK